MTNLNKFGLVRSIIYFIHYQVWLCLYSVFHYKYVITNYNSVSLVAQIKIYLTFRIQYFRLSLNILLKVSFNSPQARITILDLLFLLFSLFPVPPFTPNHQNSQSYTIPLNDELCSTFQHAYTVSSDLLHSQVDFLLTLLYRVTLHYIIG